MQRERASSTLRIANIGKLPGKTKTPDTTLLVSSEWEKTCPNHNLPSDWLSYAGWLDQRIRLQSSSTSAHISSLGHVSPTAPLTETEPRDQSAKPFELVRFHPEPSAHLHRPSSWQIRWGCVFGGRLRLSGASSLMRMKGTGGNLQDAYAINMKQQVNDTGGRTFWLSFWVHPLYSNAMSICTSCVDVKELGHIWGDSHKAAQEIGWWMGSIGYITSFFCRTNPSFPQTRSYKLGHSTLKYIVISPKKTQINNSWISGWICYERPLSITICFFGSGKSYSPHAELLQKWFFFMAPHRTLFFRNVWFQL